MDGRTDGQTMANSIVPLPHFVRRGTKKVQLDIGGEPYLCTAQALCYLSATLSITSPLQIRIVLLLWQTVKASL